MSLLTVAKIALKAAKWGAFIFGTAYVCVEMQEKIEKAIDEAKKKQAKVVEARGYSEAIADKVEIVVNVIKEAGAEVFAIVTSLGTLYGYESAAIDRWAERRMNDRLVSDLKKLGNEYEWKGKDYIRNLGRPVCYTDSGIAYNRGTGETFLDAAHDIRQIAKAYERRTK